MGVSEVLGAGLQFGIDAALRLELEGAGPGGRRTREIETRYAIIIGLSAPKLQSSLLGHPRRFSATLGGFWCAAGHWKNSGFPRMAPQRDVR